MKANIRTILNRMSLCITLFLAVVCLSGCVSCDTNITIDKKGNATIEESSLFNNDLLGMIDNEFSSKLSKLESKDDPNLTVEKLEESTATGLKITKKVQDIQKNDINYDDLLLQDVVKTQLESKRFVDIDKTFFTTKYNFDFNIEMQKDVAYVKAKITINIPTKAKSHNATSADDKKHAYTWEITKPVHNVSLEYSTVNTGNVLICLIPLLILLSGGLFAFLKLKNKQEVKEGLTPKEEQSKGENKMSKFFRTNKKAICISFVSVCILTLTGIGGVFISKALAETGNPQDIIPIHESVDAYENTMSLKEAVNTMITQEQNLNTYMSKLHPKDSKEKVFYTFMNNLEYYTKVFSYGNFHRYNHSNNDSYAKHIAISTKNKKLEQGQNDTIDELDISPVFGELSPLNVRFPNIKISKPEIPFVKLVFSGWECSNYNEDSFSCLSSEPTYFAMEPNYKYIKEKYASYLGEDWQEYFNIKIEQQQTLRNGSFENGNGGRQPSYINQSNIDKWTDALIGLLNKYPDFVLYDNVAKQIEDDNYPNFNNLLKRLKNNTKLYKRIQKAQQSLLED